MSGGGTTGGTCTPGDVEACYESADGKSFGAVPAKAVGACKIGQRTCDTNGAPGACMGAVAPEAADTCEPGNDANCNGVPNEGCTCTGGATRDCGSDVGECKKGAQTCENDAWGPCVGEVKPEATDTCDAGNDANCDGSPNNGCTCVNGATQACGSSTGNCKQGSQTCINGVWGTCSGGVTPAANDKCSPAGDDANCNGVANEGCDCTAGNTRPCAKCGTQTCDVNGKWSTACSGSKDCEPGDLETDSTSCGNCGTQSRKATCTNQCVFGAWQNVGSCLGSGPCAPGVTADQTQNISCGNCGTQKQTRACTAACDWPATWTSSGACMGSGCQPGTTMPDTSTTCGYCGEQKKQRTCDATTCQWGPVTNNGGCLQNECSTMPGDERVGYVVCEWPDPNLHSNCLASQKCCLTTGGGYSCQAACGPTDLVSTCDGPEDCGGSQCCSQYDPNENAYTYCTTSCQFNRRCHADSDCDAGWHCSTYSATSDYRNGICYVNGSNP